MKKFYLILIVVLVLVMATTAFAFGPEFLSGGSPAAGPYLICHPDSGFDGPSFFGERPEGPGFFLGGPWL